MPKFWWPKFWLIVGIAPAAVALPAAAQLRPLVEPPSSADAARNGVEVFLLNEGAQAAPAQGPAEIDTIARDGSHLHLVAAPDGEGPVAPGGFARVHYRLAAVAPATLVASAPPQDQTAAPVEAAAMLDHRPAPAVAENVVTTSAGTSGAFLDRFHAYAPIYGAFGLNDAGGKLQFSFAFRGLGHEDGPHLDFAYTQTMFWALNQPSVPFRSTTYNPELYVEMPLDATTAAAIGVRHDSNGGGPATSIDINRAYLRLNKTVALGDGWRLDLTPQAWLFIRNRGIADNIGRYWGYSAITAAIGRQDGIKLALTARGNPATGKGAAEAFLSYPLAALGEGWPHIYLFGQAWSGYGEAIDDYNRRTTRARLGIAFTR
ncbi:phospholipase A [Sphingomonas sp. GC_Shp_3]|uniref:phospholipase A n=1 Tax=Sphingomonas sp. GC_Shp_3 TaxID=2937383 RepID=UPI00226A1FAC|nr:phospholipase A [Sphingomonas sp. GC_Shp_3]